MSKKYTGYTCAVCNQVFTDTDDVVTCPDCGTPFHRACYEKTGHCLFENQHGTMAPWTAENHVREGGESSADSSMENGIICPKCGQNNPADGLFCTKCGSPLGKTSPLPPTLFGIPLENQSKTPPTQNPYAQNQNPYGQNPRNPYAQNSSPQNPYSQNFPNPYGAPLNPNVLTPEQEKEKIGDYTAGEIADAVGENPSYFLQIFRRSTQSSFSVSSNLSAFFLGPYYFLYRKMYATGGLYFLIRLLFHGLMIYTVYQTAPYTEQLMASQMSMTILPPDVQTLYTFTNAFFNFLLFLSLLVSFFFNSFYKNKVFRWIDQARTECKDSPEKEKAFLKKKGGTNKPLALVALGLVITIYVVSMILFPILTTM